MFSETLSYWKKRKKVHGDKAVGNVSEDAKQQGVAIGRELTKLLGDKFFTHGLDFGCGWGRITPYLVTHCGHLWVADIFSDWAGRAGAVGKSVTPVTLDAYELPFYDGAFDLTVDIMTLQSVNSKDWKLSAKELARVTARGGTIITLMKHDMARANDSEVLTLLEIESHDPLWCNIDTIDKSRELYCLITGTRL